MGAAKYKPEQEQVVLVLSTQQRAGMGHDATRA